MTASWLCEPPLAAFVSELWCRLPLWSPPDPARLERFRDTGPWTVASLLEDVTEPVIVNLQRADHPHTQTAVAASDAERLFAVGYSIYIPDVPRFRWAADEVADALGVPRERARASIFASRRGNRTAGHFDVNDGFAIHLVGHKRWHVAKNEHVAYPVNNWLGNDQLHPDLRYYAGRGLPNEMPAPDAAFDLLPGASLYVPRGMWHATETLSDEAIALDLALRPRSWYELLLDRVHALALAEPAWRATAVRGPGGEDPATFARLLRELATRLADLDPAHALARAVDPGARPPPARPPPARPPPARPRRYLRNPFARLIVESSPGPGPARVAVVFRTLDGDEDTSFTLDEDSHAVLAWIAAQPPDRAFDAADVIALQHLTDAADVADFLHDLAVAGLVRALAT